MIVDKLEADLTAQRIYQTPIRVLPASVTVWAALRCGSNKTGRSPFDGWSALPVRTPRPSSVAGTDALTNDQR